MPAPLRVMRLAREIVVDTALGLIRVGVPLLAIALASFALQHQLTGWAAAVALKNGPTGLGILFLSIAIRLVLLAISLYLAASAVRINGESVAVLGRRRSLSEEGGTQESLGHRLKVAMVPMVILYAAWNQVNWDIHKFLSAKFAAGLELYNVDNPAQRNDFSNISFTGGAWKAYIPWAIGVWVVKLLVDRVAERLDSRPLDLVVIYLECSWVVFGWLVLSSLVSQALAFLRTREVSSWLRQVGDWLSDLIAPLQVTFPEVVSGVVSALGAVLHVLLVQIAWPMVWVAVVGLLVGWARGDRDITLGRSSAARSVRALGGLLSSSTRGIREKYYPVLTTGRSMFRSGPLPVLTIAVLYAVLMLVLGWLRWGAYELVGPGGGETIQLNETIFSLLDALTVPLRACFLAACFAVVLRLQGTPDQSPYR
jgi:hypothetical protein